MVPISDMVLTLYQFEQCPFCAKVRQKMDSMGLQYTKVNVSAFRDADDRQELHKKSGVWTVPVLMVETDTTQFIGDSERIIEWLEKTADR